MGSSNKTTNYNLPQFVDNDKPTWLGDINGAMAAIDSTIHDTNTAVTGATNIATSAMGVANDAKSLVGTANTNASAALTAATTASSDASTAKSNALTAMTEADEAKQIAQTAVSIEKPAKASIKHVENGTYSYDVIRISGPNVNALHKQFNDGTANGTIASATLTDPKTFARAHGYTACVNAGAWIGTDGSMWNVAAQVRPVGLQIVRGVGIQEFGVGAGELVGSDVDSLILYANGMMAPAYKSDARTAAQYIASGAMDSFGYGPIIVANGAVRDIESSGAYSGFVNTPAARVIVGQHTSGDYLIIIVSGSESAGIKGNAMGTLAVTEGAQVAIVEDGGGSSQIIWQGDRVFPSSDTTGQRATFGFLVIDAPETNVYDSGQIQVATQSIITSNALPGPYPLYLRQRGPNVELTANASANIANDTWVPVTTKPLPTRYQALNDIEGRGIFIGAQGVPIGASFDTNTHLLNLRIKVPNLTSNVVMGKINWRAQFA